MVSSRTGLVSVALLIMYTSSAERMEQDASRTGGVWLPGNGRATSTKRVVEEVTLR